MSGQIKVEWGHSVEADPAKFPHGLVWASASYQGTKLHLIECEPWNVVAICGKTIIGEGREYTFGHLCGDCAKLAGVASADDLTMDPDEEGALG